MAFPEKITGFFQDRIHKLTDKERNRYILIFTAVVVVLLVLSVLLSLRSSGSEDRSEEPQRQNRLIAIPPQELFLPDEPDFIPGVILERERRLSWTEEDASEYWQDPLRDGEEPWREKIEMAIDELMEHVP